MKTKKVQAVPLKHEDTSCSLQPRQECSGPVPRTEKEKEKRCERGAEDQSDLKALNPEADFMRKESR